MGFNDDNENKEPKKIVINDSRHSRSGEVDPEPEIEQEPVVEEPQVVEAKATDPAPAETVTAPPPPEPIEFEQPAQPDEPQAAEEMPADEPAPPPPPPPAASPGAEEMTPQQAAEMEQIKMIFGAGIKTYLGGQLGILVNFALVYLGRAPNPATNLVATNLDDAKLAIDLLDLVINGLKSEFPKEEAENVANILNELKYHYMQAVQNPEAPTNPITEG